MELRNLTYRTSGLTILDGISFDVPEGSITALVGHNGAGKTTLLNCLGGRLIFGPGTLRLAGQEIDTGSDSWKLLIGTVPDSDPLFEELTVTEQLTLAGSLFGIRDPQDRIDALLDLFDLGEKRNALGSALSAGMRKRLSLAFALIHGPRILLLDEPFNGLDYASSETFFSLLEYLRSLGMRIILSAHSLEALVRLSDRIVELERGKVRSILELQGTDRSLEAVASRLGSQSRAGTPAFLPWMER